MGRTKKAQSEQEKTTEENQKNNYESPASQKVKAAPEKKEQTPESPQSNQRRASARQREAAAELSVQVEEWYECKGDKVVKCVRKKNGGSYRLFLLNRAKNKARYEKLVEKLKESGQAIKVL